MKFREAFITLHDREPSQKDVVEYERLLRVLDTTPQDAILSVLVAMGHTRAVMETIPGMVNSAVTNVSVEMRQIAVSEIERSRSAITKIAEENKGVLISAVKNGATEAITTVAREIVTAASQESMLKTVIGSMVATVVCFAAFGWWMQSTGYDKGKAETATAITWMTTPAGVATYTAYQNDVALAEWVGTKEAKQAHALSKTGDLKAIVECDRDGWVVEKKANVRICAPHPTKKNELYGWTMPWTLL